MDTSNGSAMTDKVLLKPQEVADAIGLSRAKVYALISSGEIPSRRVGSLIRVPGEDLKRWAAEKTIESQQGSGNGTAEQR